MNGHKLPHFLALLAKQSDGRFDMGVGRGDSAVRVMGRKPAKLAKMDEFIDVVKGLIRGEERQYGDVPNPSNFPGRRVMSYPYG